VIGWGKALAALLAIIQMVFRWRSDQDQRQIGRQEGTIEGFEKGKANAETRAKIESEVGGLGPDQLRERVDRWMRDKAPGGD